MKSSRCYQLLSYLKSTTTFALSQLYICLEAAVPTDLQRGASSRSQPQHVLLQQPLPDLGRGEDRSGGERYRVCISGCLVNIVINNTIGIELFNNSSVKTQ